MAKDIKIKEKATKIKTKGSVGKASDRAKIISAKTKGGVVEFKDKFKENTGADEQSPEQYAADEVTECIYKAAEDAEVVADKTVRAGVQKVRRKIRQKKDVKTENTDADLPSDEPSKEAESEKKYEDKENEQKNSSDNKKSDEKQPKKELKSSDKQEMADTKSDNIKSDRKMKPKEERSHTEKEDLKPHANVQQKQKKTVDEKKKLKQRNRFPPKTRGELSVKQYKSEHQTFKYDIGENNIKQSARSPANTRNSIKIAERTFKNAQKTEKAVQNAAKSAKKTEETTRKTVQATAKTAKVIGRAIAETAKTTATAAKELGAIITAGGIPAIVIVVVICLIGAIGGTCFGIFLSNDETTGTKKTMSQAISELNLEYFNKLTKLEASYDYDLLEMHGSISISWKDVLAVYAVKTTTSGENAPEVVTVNDEKLEILRNIVSDMNKMTGRLTSKLVAETTVVVDENGTQKEVTSYVEKKVLTVTITRLNAENAAEEYRFDDKQKEQLTEIMSAKYNAMWNELISGMGEIVMPDGSHQGTDI